MNSRVTVALPDSRHPRIAVFSGASRANPTSWVADAGSRTRRRRSIITQSIAGNACCPEVTTTVDSRMGTTSVRDSILLVGASGRTGRYVLRYLCRSAGHGLRAARIALRPNRRWPCRSCVRQREQPHTLAPLIERAAHVIYLAGGDRRSLSPGAWQVEVDGLSDCLELAKRADLPGRWISVGYSGSDQRTGATTWAETRWRELKLAADGDSRKRRQLFRPAHWTDRCFR